jgi:hypothetical protein
MATNKRQRTAVASGALCQGYYTYDNTPSGLTLAHWLFLR